jgi:hypothetical protein
VAPDRSGRVALAGDLAGPLMAHAEEIGDLDDPGRSPSTWLDATQEEREL